MSRKLAIVAYLWFGVCLFTLGIVTCVREYSREGQYTRIPNPIQYNCSVWVTDETNARKIYHGVATPDHPATYWLYDSTVLNGSHAYTISHNLFDYIDSNKYSPGDTFIFQTQIRYRGFPTEYLCEDTIIR